VKGKKATARRKKPSAPALVVRQPDGYAEHERSLTETERRVEEIVFRMQSGAWLTGVSERALAKEWRVSPITVRHVAAEASRVIRRLLRDDPEAQLEARAQIVQTFEVIRAKAMAKGDPASLRVALDATRALGFYQGVEPAKKLEVARADSFMDGWTPQEKLAFANGQGTPRRAVRSALTKPARSSGANGHAGNGSDPDGMH
jgi:hypothetical protein